ncbi:MAG: type I-U CRISPR-associated RAMP protein Csb1/Cas7u, partial [Phycisphaeraceae bacterium]
MPDNLTQFDHLLADNGPAAITLKQPLKPVGEDVVFPPTYAAPKDDRSGKPRYNIDTFGSGDNTRSVCTLDSVPSQINRIEPAFATIADGRLVPRVIVTAKQKDGSVQVDLLEAGHRAADAIVRFSGLAEELEAVFKARLKGDSLPLAKIAPTSLVFGVWDSRATGTKVPRLLNAIIRAYDVDELTRSAQYVPALPDYAEAGVGSDTVKKLSEHGMAAVPASGQL